MRAGLAAVAALVGVLLAGCGGGSVPNQRVYDRYATLMQERYRQQMQTPAQTVETHPAAVSTAPAKTTTPPAPPKKKPQPVPEPKKSAKTPKDAKPAKAEPEPVPAPLPEPVPEPVPAEPVPVVEDTQESVEVIPEIVEEIPEVVEVIPEVAEPPVEIVPAEPTPVAEPEPEPVAEPEQPEPAPVEVVEPPVVPVVQPPPPPAYDDSFDSDAMSDEASAYALKIGDGVQITLRGIPTPEKIECQVDEYGMVALPLINDVKAEGLSGAQLAKNIRQIYLERGIYKNINVTVLIPTRYYFTQGEFKSTGKFQLVSAINLSQAIAGSGYFTDFANGRVFIRRNGVIFKTVNNAKRLDRTPEDDILIEPGDIIEAQRSRW